ncbi:Protein kinase domain [Carpediemonas membranifera]|uniref:Protein kinase domain n=1 Tax=Carpediemonas membranifera TaxID=201153 RepID=A0A8J6E172_9EUKA|nr:Protein kinase domain [Carpediemonas membranifera]|eukprot:KAG9390262.1 Protein kinase domain [Carpediemonas membranifera]
MIPAKSLICMAEESDSPINRFSSTIIGGRYHVLEALGTGSYSFVHLGEDMATKKRCAIKVMSVKNEEHIQAAENEVTALRRVSRVPAVASLLEVESTDENMFIVTEYGGSTSLQALVNRFQYRGLDPASLRRVASGLLKAIRQCHRHGVAHCDVKLDNILFTQGAVTLIDFGSAFVEGRQNNTRLGSVAFRPPESFSEDFKLDARAAELIDAWGVGLSLFCAARGIYPFDGASMFELINDIRRVNLDQLFQDFENDQLAEMLRGLMAPVDRRWTVEKALRSRYMSPTKTKVLGFLGL